MKNIGVSIRNRVFSDGLLLMLKQTGDFRPAALPWNSSVELETGCLSLHPDILLLDVMPAPESMTLEERLGAVAEIRRSLPQVKVAVFCDETAYPELAIDVMRAKQEGRIDAFYYASVSAQYLTAALNAL